MSIGEHFGVEREGLDKVHWTVFTTMEKLGLFSPFRPQSEVSGVRDSRECPLSDGLGTKEFGTGI